MTELYIEYKDAAGEIIHEEYLKHAVIRNKQSEFLTTEYDLVKVPLVFKSIEITKEKTVINYFYGYTLTITRK